MQDRTRLMIAIILLLLAVGLFFLGMAVLPDVLVMQVQTDGSAGTTLPKTVGLLIPLAICTIFALLYYQLGKPKDLVVALVGLAVYGFTFLFNR